MISVTSDYRQRSEAFSSPRDSKSSFSLRVSFPWARLPKKAQKTFLLQLVDRPAILEASSVLDLMHDKGSVHAQVQPPCRHGLSRCWYFSQDTIPKSLQAATCDEIRYSNASALIALASDSRSHCSHSGARCAAAVARCAAAALQWKSPRHG